jgi:hypothetical protein
MELGAENALAGRQDDEECCGQKGLQAVSEHWAGATLNGRRLEDNPVSLQLGGGMEDQFQIPLARGSALSNSPAAT